MQKNIKFIILFISFVLTLVPAYGASQKIQRQKKHAKLAKFSTSQKKTQYQSNIDPYLGFRPETDPAKIKTEAGPAKGTNPAAESEDLIRKQRVDVNRVNNPAGSDLLTFPSNK